MPTKEEMGVGTTIKGYLFVPRVKSEHIHIIHRNESINMTIQLFLSPFCTRFPSLFSLCEYEYVSVCEPPPRHTFVLRTKSKVKLPVMLLSLLNRVLV